MGRTRRRRAISRKRYRARGGMSGMQFNSHAEKLETILKPFETSNKGHKTTEVLRALIENEFKKPIIRGLDSDQRKRRGEIDQALDKFIEKWLDREDFTEEWNNLNALLFPAE